MLASPAGQLGRNLRDLPFTLTYLFDDDGARTLAGVSGIAAGHPAAREMLAADGSGGVAGRRRRRAASRRSSTWTAPRSPNCPTGAWPEPPDAGAGGAAAAAGRRARADSWSPR